MVYRPGPRPVVVERDTYVDVLPRGARVVTVRGERCWLYNGRYYRRHPHRHGYVVFVP